MPASLNRRTLLIAGSAGLTGLAVPFPLGASATPHNRDVRRPRDLRVPASDELLTLRERWRDRVTGEAARTSQTAADPQVIDAIDRLDATAAQAWNELLPPGDGRDRLWPDLPLAPHANNNHGLSYERVFELARAWSTPDCRHQGDTDLLDAIRDALAFLHERVYNPNTTPSGNWWWWEIGNPRALLDTCVLLGDALPDDERADYTAAVEHFSPDPNFRGDGTEPETGANRVDKATITVLRGILQQDAAVVERGRDALSDTAGDGIHSVFQYVTSGDGFYTDGSFIQHGNLPYVGTYGVVALSGIGDLLYLCDGSPWAVTDPDATNLFDNVEAAFVPFIRGGHMFDTVRGRAVSRQREPDSYWGQRTIGALLLVADLAGTPYRDRFLGLSAGWLERNPDTPFVPSIDLDTLHRSAALLAADGAEAVDPVGQLVTHRVFPNQDRFVHHRPGWSFTVSLSSERIGRFEAGNEENVRGWYLGDGMTYLYLDDDPGHYADDYWPTVDSYRHAGVTRRVREREELWDDWTGVPPGSNTWVGGCSLASRFGAAGMDFADSDGVLVARKSWFSLDDEVVALGAGIATSDEFPVETVVDNRAYAPGPARRVLTDNGPARGDGVLESPAWLHMDGVGGYVFPQPQQVHLLDEERRGAWSDINTGADNAGNDDVKVRRYTTLWLDHGVSPTAATYAYVVLPGASPGQTRRRAGSDDVNILANTPEIQAIAQYSTGVVLANFFAAGDAGSVNTTAPCSVGVVDDGAEVTVSVADPSRRNGAPARMTFPNLSGLRQIDGHDTITVIGDDPLTLECATADTVGAVQEVRFTRSAG